MSRFLALAAAMALAGCGASYSQPADVALPPPVTAESVELPPAVACDNKADVPPAVASYPPLAALPPAGQMPAGTRMREIQERGRLIVGTSIDTLLFASVNPSNGNIEGFDIDVAKLVASAIFGIPIDDPALDQKLDLKGITYAQRIPKVSSGEVDIIAHTMTINCTRWQQGVAFSSVYLNAGQKLLVAKGSDVTTMADLAGSKVCASAGGTSADELKAAGAEIYPPPSDSNPTGGVGNQTDCLVLLQRGEVDAIRSDDTVLAGFANQDPNTEVVGKPLTQEPYGLAIAADHPEFVQFVNAVLDQARAPKPDGTPGDWQRLYDRWLRPTLGDPVANLDENLIGIPQPDHSRPLPRA